MEMGGGREKMSRDLMGDVLHMAGLYDMIR